MSTLTRHRGIADPVGHGSDESIGHRASPGRAGWRPGSAPGVGASWLSSFWVSVSPRVSLPVVTRNLVVLAIRFYQRVISPWTAPSCRYYPSCSQFAVVAVQRFGVARGGWLGLRRLARCHPWSAGGVDHVPTRPSTPTPPLGA